MNNTHSGCTTLPKCAPTHDEKPIAKRLKNHRKMTVCLQGWVMDTDHHRLSTNVTEVNTEAMSNNSICPKLHLFTNSSFTTFDYYCSNVYDVIGLV